MILTRDYSQFALKLQSKSQFLFLTTKEEEEDSNILARFNLVGLIGPQITRSFSFFNNKNDVESLLNAFLLQCISTNVYTPREDYQRIINLKMCTTKILISYQGRIQELILRLDWTNDQISRLQKWGILTKGL